MWTTVSNIVTDILCIAVIVWLWMTRQTVGAYLSAYGGEKGKSLATHEDIEKILADLRATTKATEEIKAQISSEVWDRQRQWEMKREVLFDAVKRVAEVDNALQQMNVILQSTSASVSTVDELTKAKSTDAALRRWITASRALDETRLLVEVVCDIEAVQAIGSLENLTSAIAAGISNQKAGTYENFRKQLVKSLAMVRLAIRKELGVGDIFATPQSSESSAAPGPAGLQAR